MIESTLLRFNEWQIHTATHLARVKQFTDPYRQRRSVRKSHPILDFLFTYYSFPIGRLETWHPALGQHIELQGQVPKTYLEQHYSEANGYYFLDTIKLTEQRRDSIRWMVTLLRNTESQTPIFGCYGMHEWAMVYQGVDVRHRESVPLRLSQQDTDAFVESRPVICSHYDAFRFFTEASKPYNKLQPTSDTRETTEQPACVHANMDLYKWAYKCMPWVGSDFLWKTFNLALEMRELDMRAAPYDLSEYNYTPIQVETPEGRRQYEVEQRRLSNKAAPLRSELASILEALIGVAVGN